MYDDYAALIFDMDGTLVDSGQLHEFSWRATLQRYGIPIDGPLMRSLAGVPTRETLELLVKKFHCPAPCSVEEMNAFKEQCVRDSLHRFVQPTALIDVVKKYHRRKTHGHRHGCQHGRGLVGAQAVWSGPLHGRGGGCRSGTKRQAGARHLFALR
jgi:phosphoglycolate phosphatase-like HAD superfamily hydrolase